MASAFSHCLVEAQEDFCLVHGCPHSACPTTRMMPQYVGSVPTGTLGQDVGEKLRPPRKLVYIAGSMRNREGILAMVKALEDAGYDTFHSWVNPGPETDDKWMEWQRSLGRDYFEAMADPHVANVYNFDKHWLREADALVMVGPAGKSAHAELGFMHGSGKPTYVLMESEPERWDIMTGAFASAILRTREEVVKCLRQRL